MKKIFLFLLIFIAVSGYAQKPLSFSLVIQKEGIDAQTLYDLTRNWFAQSYGDSKAVLQDQNPGKELTGRGSETFSIPKITYSGMDGYIDYIIDIQFKDGRMKLTLNNFVHKPTRKVKYDNEMGVVIDSLPDNLETLGGKFGKSSHRMYYKTFHKYAKPVCDIVFKNISNSLQEFINNRESTKDDW